MAITLRKGRSGRVKVITVKADPEAEPPVEEVSETLKVTNFTMEYNVPEVRANHTESGGFQILDSEGGIASVSGSISVLLEKGIPVAIYSGTFVGLQLYPGDKESTPWEFDAFINQNSITNAVDTEDGMVVELAYGSSGDITPGD